MELLCPGAYVEENMINRSFSFFKYSFWYEIVSFMWYLLNLPVLGKRVGLFQKDIKSKPGISIAVGGCQLYKQYEIGVFQEC